MGEIHGISGSAVGFCVTAAGSYTADLSNFTNSILLRALTVPFGMDELDLPSRLFDTGFESTGKKMVNNYLNLRWIEVIMSAL
ncbi:hypothetical protein F2Q68_00026515 [Brassica cretica]|uniref:Uncharacterized protein n=1 Tax=Brassica cretica TaxID=69181 RepID=A0A8S9IHT7_BRACR|nr:hypothetical protein F2Q68_00026515 [Brassica cretica]